jgi:hypothetical protein
VANVRITVAAIAAFTIVSKEQAVAEMLDPGKAEYHSSCAPCYGVDGKGNGPVRAGLKVLPPDLTVLAKKNNGMFPFNYVYGIIDGRKTVMAHGTRDMPFGAIGIRLSLARHRFRGRQRTFSAYFMIQKPWCECAFLR